jgi:hypothetical protein
MVDASWQHYQADRQDFATVSQYCPERPYVQLKIPEDRPIEVRRLVFTTVSHDQGFSHLEEKYGGTYGHSYTWFDAQVIMPSGHDQVLRRKIQVNVHA